MQSELRRHDEINSFRFDQLLEDWQGLVYSAANATPVQTLYRSFSELLSRLHEYLPFDYLGIGLLNSSRTAISVLLHAGDYELPPEFPVLENSLGLVVHERQSIEVPNVECGALFSDLSDLCKPSPYRSFRVVPLATERHSLGTLMVARKCIGAFSAEDVRHLGQVGELVSVVLENTLMADVLAREKSRLEALLDLNSAMVSRLNIQKLFVEISSAMRRLIRNEFTHLGLHDPSADVMKILVLDSESL